MKVLVVGATGTVGRLAVSQLLAKGHHVTAFARRPEKIGHDHDRLTVAAGDATDLSAVTAAMRGHDAVIVALGSGMSLTSRIRSKGTLTIIQAMQTLGISRLICQSTLGAHESWSNLNFYWKRIMFGLILRNVFRDHELQEMLVRASGLDWTIVRPSAFTDGPVTNNFREGFLAGATNLKLKISRSDVGAFLVRQVSDRQYLHQAVAISH